VGGAEVGEGVAEGTVDEEGEEDPVAEAEPERLALADLDGCLVALAEIVRLALALAEAEGVESEAEEEGEAEAAAEVAAVREAAGEGESEPEPAEETEAEEETADSSSKRHISKETSKLHTWTGSTAAYGKLLKN
jgi:hypothetical protein